MKQIIIILNILFLTSALSGLLAQDMPKRYATLELFTNTPCPICVVNNPAFFNLLSNYSDDVHQISFYPGRPYSTCPIYQSNTSDNSFRSSYRNIFSTPRVFFNGENAMSTGSVNANDLNEVTGDESFLYINVSEVGSTSRTATVQLQTFDDSPTSSGKLFATIVEKEVMLTGIPPSWEELHHNVFREFLTAREGMTVDLTQADQSFSFNYTIDSEWDADEIYVLAWVEHPDTKVILNSGTKFDEEYTDTKTVFASSQATIFPNPVSDFLNIDLANGNELSHGFILNPSGKVVLRFSNDSRINVSHLSSGIYTALIVDQSQEQQFVRFIKKK